MFKLYDTAFKMGFGFTVLVFIILNILSYVIANNEKKEVDFSPCCIGPSWGFPLDMTHYETFSLNILIIAGCGLVIGLAFRFVWAKLNPKIL